MRILRSLFIVALVLLAACQPTISASPGVDVSNVFRFSLNSPAFLDTGMMPKVTSCQGDNKSPELAWKSLPTDTRSLALIMEDPDAPGDTPFTHWVLYDIPARVTKLTEGTQVGVSGLNSLKNAGYMGPCPPGGIHRYYFRLYAVDEDSLGLPAGATRAQVETALKGHVIGVADLMGRYEQQ
jgi:Raf kinase inhibitor-like YbhB/YbcL family protein